MLFYQWCDLWNFSFRINMKSTTGSACLRLTFLLFVGSHIPCTAGLTDPDEIALILKTHNDARAAVNAADMYELVSFETKLQESISACWWNPVGEPSLLLALCVYIREPSYYKHAWTHWGRVTHICVSNLTIIGSDHGWSPGRRQAIIRTNTWILLIGPSGTNFIEMLVGNQTFSFRKMHLKMSSVL